VKPAIVDGDGKVLEGACEGNLVITDSWPGQMRTVFGDHERFIDTYFKTFSGCYFTGDGARRDEDGYYWITGRVDDVLNVAGHRLGTAEIESALVSHAKVAESAVVGFPHEIKGQGIYAYVTLVVDAEPTEQLRRELRDWVRKEIGPIATPDRIQWAPGLPKTRSGKIMRRILRKIAANEVDQLGDVSTLADPSVVEQLVRGLTETQRAELREGFSYIDADRDGRLELPEFAKLLASLKAGMTEQHARSGFAAIDTDRDGRITFDEFAAWWIRG
jgi:acetyl-CoA synthetase